MALQDLHKPDISEAWVTLEELDPKHPFASGLEYTCPARGTWTIAHTPMIIPGSHMIYVGASACMRGVVLSAAEYEGLDRFSMVLIEEHDLASGNLEDLFVDGISDILHKLRRKPTAVMPFVSCIHHFVGMDFEHAYKRLREKFPEVDFISCHMIPTMKKSGYTAEEMIRRSLYDALEPTELDYTAINLIGGNETTKLTGDHVSFLRDAGYRIRDLAAMTEYEEYKAMAASWLNVYQMPVANYAAGVMQERLGQQSIYLPNSYDYEEIRADMGRLAELVERASAGRAADVAAAERVRAAARGVSARQGEAEARAEAALAKALQVIGRTPIAIDYSATTRSFGLAKLLLEHGFNVVEIYGDAVVPDDMPALDWLKEHYPKMPFKSAINFRSRFYPRDAAAGGKLLAIGQKAAYFTGTTNFVNLIENNGLYGFDGIAKIADLMIDAYENEKDPRKIIQVKAWGCSA